MRMDLTNGRNQSGFARSKSPTSPRTTFMQFIRYRNAQERAFAHVIRSSSVQSRLRERNSVRSALYSAHSLMWRYSRPEMYGDCLMASSPPISTRFRHRTCQSAKLTAYAPILSRHIFRGLSAAYIDRVLSYIS